MIINYNSFYTSAIAFPIIYILAYGLAAASRVKNYFDPVSGEQLTEGEQQQFQFEYMARVLLFLVIFLVHHYLTLLDIGKMAIEKYLLKRSQSQLYDYIN